MPARRLPTSTWPPAGHCHRRTSTSRCPKPLPIHAEALEASRPRSSDAACASRLEMGGQISRDAYIKAQGDRAQVARGRRCGAVELRCAGAPDAADTTAEDRRRRQSIDRLRRRAAETADAPADPAVQPHRASGDFAAVRRYARRDCRADFSWSDAGSRRRAAAGRAQLRSVRDSTCTFIFPRP